MKPLKIGIIAGEHSGDILGADLMSALSVLAQQNGYQIEYRGVAGPLMLAKGALSYFDMEELAVMGAVEILKRLPRLLKKRKQLVADLVEWQPDVVIGIDAPEFNLGLELMLKEQGIKTVHYVSPSVWAWRQSRVHKIKKAVDLVLALLPFEKAFYDKFQVPCEFVGHTTADTVPVEDQQLVKRQELGYQADDLILGVLPGSRSSELKFLLTPFLQAAQELKKQLPQLKVLLPAVNEKRLSAIKEVVDEEFKDLDITLSVGNARDVMAVSDAVLLASGTATLETMLMKTPMVACYRVSWLSYQIFSRLVKTPYLTLPNLLAQQKVIPELIQDDMSVDNIVQHVKPMLTKPQTETKQKFTELHKAIRLNASDKVAASIWQLLEKAGK